MKQLLEFNYSKPVRTHLLPPANEVWGKVICLQVCVCPEGGAWSRRVSGPRGCLALGVGARGCLVPGGMTGPGPGGPPGRLLLRAVRILLECILVFRAIDVDKLTFTILITLTLSGGYCMILKEEYDVDYGPIFLM